MKYKVIENELNIELDERFNNQNMNYFLEYYLISKKMKQYWLDHIKVNNNKININTILKINDQLTIDITANNDVYPSNHECEVIYEDDLVLIVKKPSGQIIHDDQSNDALINDVSCYFNHHNYQRLVRPIHRLDEDTQGLVFFSKVLFFQSYFDYLLQEKKIERYYYAICKGKAKAKFTINKPIGKDRHNNNRFICIKSGKEALTNVKLIKFRKGYSLVECRLKTGRTHQIRVHLASMNLPIVNDVMYGVMDSKFKYMGLYAFELDFINPITFEIHRVVYKNYDDLKYFGG